MAFSGDEIEIALSGLRLKLRLPCLYPAQLCKREGPDNFAAPANGRGNAHMPVRGIDGDVHMLDILTPDGNLQVADGDGFRAVTHGRTDWP